MTIGCRSGDSRKDRPIYVRITGHEENRWYVIVEKSWMNSFLSSASEVIGCKSERDVVRRLPLPDSGLPTNNLAVVNSRMYLIGGDLSKYTHFGEDSFTYNTYTNSDDDSLGYRYIDLKYFDKDLKAEVKGWPAGGGRLVDHQFGGGVAVAHDGYVYSVGPRVYRFHPDVGKCERLPIPPQGRNPMPNGFLHPARLLGVSSKKLYVYTEENGDCNANVMLSFDFQSGKWDDVLDDKFWGDWSPGAVLYDDRYLFSFGIRNPKRRPMTSMELEEEGEDEEVSGIYVFDLEQRRWLPEPIEGLPSDGTVVPQPYKPLPWDVMYGRRFSPQLLQIREDDNHHLALLWDSVGVCICGITWCKFIVDVCTTTTDDDIPRFYAHSLSPGSCQLDEKTGGMLNCAVGCKH